MLGPAVKDRSSAMANQLIDEIVEKLKKTDSHHLTISHPIGWRIWATYIASRPSHSHDQLILDTPTEHVVLLFRNIVTSEAEIVANAQQGLCIARNVNGFQRANLLGIRDRVKHIQSNLESCQRDIENLLTHLDYLEQQADREDSLLSDVNTSVRTNESTFSIDTASMVADCEDVDHVI